MIPSTAQRLAFWALLVSMTVALVVATGEVFASFVAAPYPMRMLRPYLMKPGLQIDPVEQTGSARVSDLVPYINAWGLRDRERSLQRPQGVDFRSVFVGDSFLEGHHTRAAIPARVEELWARHGNKPSEAINLGISATGPAQYYYRIKRFALDLKPDLVVVMFYSGNDFIFERFGGELIPPLIQELPQPSFLGAIAPRLTWVAVDRLRVAEAARNVRPIPNEFETLRDMSDKPGAERTAGLVAHMKRFYYPNMSEATLREVLARGDDSFWDAFRRESPDRQYLSGPFLYSVIDWEKGAWPVPASPAEAGQDKYIEMNRVDATFTWIAAMRILVEGQGARFIVAMAPTGAVDPEYVSSWKAWPRYYSFNVTSDARHQKFVSMLRADGFTVVDLRDDLLGVAGTYRIGDGHWNERGHEIVAKRLARELGRSSR